MKQARAAGVGATFGFAAICFMLAPSPARASGDVGCSPDWTLAHAQETGCDNMVVLSPGNDTRVNLLLLLGRAQPAPAPPPPLLPAIDPASPGAAKRGPVRADPLFDWATYQAWTWPRPTGVGDADYAAGEGSRCLSDKAGAAAFAEAIGHARGVAPDERTALVAARQALKPTCTDNAGTGNADTGRAGYVAGADASAAPPPQGPVTAPPVRSPAARAFAAYLEGVSGFYAGDFGLAASRFQPLVRSDQPWLRETALYMLGRVEVNRAQVGVFDEYGYHDDKHPIDQRAVAAAEAGLLAYLRAYPAGRYAASAQGLLRRVYWFGGDNRKLAAQYVALIALPRAERDLDDPALAEEIDNKLLPTLKPGDTTDPTLLAVLDLRAMRHGEGAGPTLTRPMLEAQAPSFARDPALYEHLLASFSFHVLASPLNVAQTLPDASHQAAFDSVQFSRQVLRGMALEFARDRNVRGFWLSLLPGATTPHQRATVELALALHDERNEGLDRVFASGSPVRNAMIRDILLTNVADAALLRRQVGEGAISVHERGLALFTLLYRDITRGGYRDFVSDVAQVSAGAAAKEVYYGEFVGDGDAPTGIFTSGRTAEDFACPALRQTAARLASDPRDATARLCLGEFIRLNDLDDFVLDVRPPADQLGGTPSRFAGTPTFSRLEAYKAIIAGPGASADNRAYALFRAVNCYGPSGNNGCGGTEVSPAVRKGWFVQLHRDYPASRWARESKYYW